MLKKNKNKNQDISIPAPPMNEAMTLDAKGLISSTIYENTCYRKGKCCIYAPNLKDPSSLGSCEFKDAMDDFMYGCIKSGLIVDISINFCEHFESDSNIEDRLDKINVEDMY